MNGINIKDVNIFKEDDQWFAEYPVGWKSCTDDLGSLHGDVAETRKEILSLVRSALPCDCLDCYPKKITPHKGGRTEVIQGRFTSLEKKEVYKKIKQEGFSSFSDWVVSKI